MSEGHNKSGTVSPRLSEADQQRVDSVIYSGVNSVERKPFRPFLLLGVIMLVMFLLSGFSYLLARWYGVV